MEAAKAAAEAAAHSAKEEAAQEKQRRQERRLNGATLVEEIEAMRAEISLVEPRLQTQRAENTAMRVTVEHDEAETGQKQEEVRDLILQLQTVAGDELLPAWVQDELAFLDSLVAVSDP